MLVAAVRPPFQSSFATDHRPSSVWLCNCVTVNGGHEPLLDAKAFLEQHVDDRSQTVCRTARVGNDMVLVGVVFVVVDAHNDRDVIALSGSRDNDFFGAGIEMTLGLCGFGKEPCRFDHDVHAELLPGKGSRTLGDGETLDFAPVHYQGVVFRGIGR